MGKLLDYHDAVYEPCLELVEYLLVYGTVLPVLNVIQVPPSACSLIANQCF
jgi:hypothetical protein